MRNCRRWWRRSATCRCEPAFAAARAGGGAVFAAQAVRRWRRAARRRFGSDAAEAARANREPGCVDWRPSCLLAAALVLVGLLAAFAALACELPPPLAWPLAALAAGWGAALARAELRRPPRRLRFAGTRAWLDDAPIAQLRLHWRGPLARLEFRTGDGRRGRLLWWPDCLDAHGRRELRLAATVVLPASSPRSVAP